MSAEAAAAAPVPGSPEHDAAMAAKVDASAEAARAAAAPSPVAKPAEAPKEPESATNEPAVGDQKAAEAAVANVGLDYAAFNQEFQEKGELSEESYKKLTDSGIPKDMVDAYIEGQKAIVAASVTEVFNSVGGEDSYRRMTEWAKTAYTPQQIEAFNKATSGSKEEMLQAVAGLKSRFDQAYGRSPQLLGGQGADAGTAGFASRNEMTTAMRDPRYSKDPAYRKSVEARLAATTAF